MTQRVGDFLPRKIDQYCPAMGYAADVIHSAPSVVNFGAPAVADVDALVLATGFDLDAAAAETIVAAAFETASNAGIMDAPFGRNVTLSASGDPGADVTFTITGRDYLGQPMTEVLVIADGTTSEAGLKAFKYVDSIAHDASSSNAVTGGAGFGDVLGLPYKCKKVLSEELDNVIVATLGTLVTADLTDPATATDGDPRGTYDPQSTLTGSAVLTITALFDNTVNASGNGGLHGIKHYTA